jgi:hypothetical protein
MVVVQLKANTRKYEKPTCGELGWWEERLKCGPVFNGRVSFYEAVGRLRVRRPLPELDWRAGVSNTMYEFSIQIAASPAPLLLGNCRPPQLSAIA